MWTTDKEDIDEDNLIVLKKYYIERSTKNETGPRLTTLVQLLLNRNE